MKYSVIGLLSIFIIAQIPLACQNGIENEKEEEVVLPEMMEQTFFPDSELDDYKPMGYQARIAFPRVEGKGRVWVKGSERYTSYKMNGKSYPLSPPNYTDVFNTSSEEVKIEFEGEDSENAVLQLFPKKKEYFQGSDDFSILTYGCFQPFHVNEETGKPVLRTDTSENELILRKAFRDIAFEKKYPDGDSISSTLKKPVAVVNTGDQVYVDAAYYTKVKPNPMSAWSVGDRPLPTLNVKAFKKHLSDMYQSFGSFTTLNEVFSHIPAVSVWDDHEIRDGWGSQGDEYLDSTNGYTNLNPRFKPYFMAARQAYLDHQIALGPEPSTPIDTVNGSDLHQELNIKGMPVFMMDLRGQRNVLTSTVMDETQIGAFEQWLAGMEQGSTVIIVSSVPLFWEAPESLEKIGNATKTEMEDDIADAWGSKYNETHRDRIYRILVRYRMEKDIKPIILSGDIHVGAVNEVWYQPKEEDKEIEPGVLAYEMVVSGFAHKDLSEQSWSAQLVQMAGSQGELASALDMPGTGQEVDVFVRMQASAAKLNFGAVEKIGDSVILSLFVKDTYEFAQLRLTLNWDKELEGKEFKIEEIGGKASASTYINKDSGITKREIREYR